jgi:nitroreductase/dihydropteridine reductase
MSILENLKWRYATKKFDSTYELSESELNTIKEVIQLSPASFGLQPYKVLIVTNPEIRILLKAASWNQPQITDSSALLVFVKNNNIDETEVDLFVENIINTRGVTKEMLEEYEGMMKHAVSSQTDEQKGIWVEKQIYLAVGNLLTSLSVLGIDSCPMEGFDRGKYDSILGLTETSSVVICPIGKRDDSDEYQNYPKVRKSTDDLFEII